MKTTFTLVIALFTSLTIWAGNTSTSPDYFICHFNDTITKTELLELKKEGFEVFNTKTDKHVVYVKAKSNSVFSKKLKSQMKELIRVDKNGNRVYIIEDVTEDSPEFLKLFFNFI